MIEEELEASGSNIDLEEISNVGGKSLKVDTSILFLVLLIFKEMD